MIGQAVRGCTLGILRKEMKHVNRKTCDHQISRTGLMKQVQVQSCAAMSVGVCSGGSTM